VLLHVNVFVYVCRQVCLGAFACACTKPHVHGDIEKQNMSLISIGGLFMRSVCYFVDSGHVFFVIMESRVSPVLDAQVFGL
jgi:hypothetical protein